MIGRNFSWKVWSGVAAAACCGVLGLEVLALFSVRAVLDDAFMFVRYADRVLAEGRVAWDPGGAPTFGLTSPLYLSVVVAVRAFVSRPALAAGLSSLFSGMLFLVLVVRLLRGAPDAEGRRLPVFLVLFPLALSAVPVATHFVSGMDTAFAMAFLTAYLLIARCYERAPTGRRSVGLGLWGGLAFWARPDLLLYSVLVPASVALWGSSTQVKRGGWRALGITGLVVGVQVAFSAWYFGSPLPLSFYAKGLWMYGSFLKAQYRLVPAIELVLYLASYWYIFLIVGMDLALNRAWWRSGASAIEKGVLAATGLFILYYLFCVLQIMPRPQRFYYPTLPALLFLAGRGVVRLAGRVPEALRRDVWPRSGPVRAFALLFFLGMLFPPALTAARGVVSQARRGDLLNFDVAANYRERFADYWFRLEAFSRLPDDLVIATTEVGRPAALNPGKRIVDLTGLNETAFALHGFSADRLFHPAPPDLIYMPHPHYRNLIAQILNSPYFKAHYEYFPARSLGTEMGVALWRESRYYDAMRRIVEKDRP